MSEQRPNARTAERLEVRSADGTRIAVWVEGDGAPFVLVHGSLRDHRIFKPLVAELRGTVTTFALDRRGFGASGDAAGYGIEREFDDVAAVIDVVAARCGAPVALFGHSYGAGCAMGGATRSDHVAHLVLYEPGLGIPYPPGWIEANQARLAAGEAEAVIVAVLRDILGMTDGDIDATRAAGGWSELLAAGTTVLREARVEDSWVYRPGALSGLRAPTLFLAGSDTPPAVADCTKAAAAAIPGAHVTVLEGHGHLAFQDDPALVAAIVRQFMASGRIG
jgi:pimeloyl-ACP methyl ester carboxylesterase